LFQIDTTNTTAILYVTPVKPVSEYIVSYGIGGRTDQYAGLFSSSQTEGVISFTVGSLVANTAYTFKIRGGNGCATGNWSNARTATTSQSANIVATVSRGTPPPICSYTVKPGDTLWEIAVMAYGDGTLYHKIIERNSKKYPDVASSLKTGMMLEYLCDKEDAEPNIATRSTDGLRLYDIEVKVQDKGKPLAGVRVDLHSDPMSAVTNTSGVARFSSVKEGEHTLTIAYKSHSAEQKLFVTGDNVKQSITINITFKNNTLPTWTWLSIICLLQLFNSIPSRKRRIFLRKIKFALLRKSQKSQ
jgi:hypothetical protein